MSSPTGKKKADLKIVILGAANVGKTTFIHRYIERNFQDQISTIGASFSLKQWGPYNVAIWDTAGEERFSGLSSFYCRGAGAAILAFDVTNEDTFSTLRSRFIPLLSSANDHALCVVVGTKKDLLSSEDHMRQVKHLEGVELCQELNSSRTFKNVPYFETSSLTGENVDRVFDYILQELLPLTGDEVKDRKVKRASSTVDLEKPKKEPATGCKC